MQAVNPIHTFVSKENRQTAVKYTPNLAILKNNISAKKYSQTIAKILTIIFFSFLIIQSFQTSLRAQKPKQLGKILQEDLRITSSFGEYRFDHLHQGIDFSVQSKIGIPIYNPLDGYIHELGFDSAGYGLFLTIRHKDGTYTKYAHLQDLSQHLWKIDDLEDFRDKVTDQHNFSEKINSDILIKMGSVLAFSGETGVGPPHLHFEYWDKEQNPLNPFTRKVMKIQDPNPPIITRLFIDPLGPLTRINGKDETLELNPLRISRNKYRIREQIKINGPVRLRIAGYDTANTDNILGFYSIELNADAKKIYSLKFDKISKDEKHRSALVYDNDTTSFNGIIYVYKLFSEKGWPLKNISGDGIIHAKQKPIKVNLTVRDSFANRTTLSFKIFSESKYISEAQFKKENLPERFNLLPDERLSLETKKVSAEFEKNSTYTPKKIEVKTLSSINGLPDNIDLTGKAYRLEPADMQLEKPVHIRIKIPRILQKNLGLYYVQESTGYIRLIKKNSELQNGDEIEFASTRLGTFAFLTDSSSPEWLGTHFNPGKKYLPDELIPAAYIKDKGLGIDPKSIEVYLNAKRVKAKYNPNRNWIRILPEETEGLQAGRYKISMQVKDLAGNRANILERSFRLTNAHGKFKLVDNESYTWSQSGQHGSFRTYFAKSAQPSQSLRLASKDNKFTIHFPPESFANRNILRRVFLGTRKTDSLRIRDPWNIKSQNAYFLYIPGKRTKKKFQILFKRKNISENNKLSVLRISGNRKEFISKFYNPGEESFEIVTDQGGAYIIYLDNESPSWGKSLFREKKIYEKYNIPLAVYLFDSGTGVDPASIRARIDDQEFPVHYNSKNHLLKVLAKPNQLKKGFRRLRIQAKDYAGNPAIQYSKYFIIRYKRKWIWN